MTIIKHGKFYHEATCPYCECVFGYVHNAVKSDVKLVSGDDGRFKDAVVCPECGFQIPFNI